MSHWRQRLFPNASWQGSLTTWQHFLHTQWQADQQLLGTQTAQALQHDANVVEILLPAKLPAFDLTLQAELPTQTDAQVHVHLSFPTNSTAVFLLWSFVLMGWSLVQVGQNLWQQHPFVANQLAPGGLGALCYLGVNYLFWRKAGKVVDALSVAGDHSTR